MATWMVHFRIADYFLDKLKGINSTDFAIGSVAPDCGYGKKDSRGEFTPPPNVTHWSPSGNKRDCRYKDYAKEYLHKISDIGEYSFHLGYYIHLLTDIMWSSEIYMGSRRDFADEYREDKNFLRTVKEDWNDLDFLYFHLHPDVKSYHIIDKVKDVRDYLSYYEPGQLKQQIQFIADYYKNPERYDNIDRDYMYLSTDKIDGFIHTAQAIITENLKKNNLAVFAD